MLSAENDFYDLVDAHVDKPLRVYVYSYDFDTLREVVLIPNRHWGGEGLLGCVFGFGLLHRIPPQPEDRVPGTIPPELQEQADEYETEDLFVPADAELQQGHHNPSQMAEWRRREQEQWTGEAGEVLARSTLATSNQPSSVVDNLSDITPRTNNHAMPTPSRSPLSHSNDGLSPKRS